MLVMTMAITMMLCKDMIMMVTMATLATISLCGAITTGFARSQGPEAAHRTPWLDRINQNRRKELAVDFGFRWKACGARLTPSHPSSAP